MGSNLLRNPSFESGKFSKVDKWGSMTVPDGWHAFFVNNPGRKRVPWDPKNTTGIVAPEFKPVDKKPPYLDPPRGRWREGGQWAMCWFAFWKVMDAGLYQQVNVTPDQELRLTAWAHGWSNSGDGEISGPHANDPKWSDGQGVGYNDFYQLADPAWPNRGGSALDDAARNMVFQLGIDPAGGQDPWAPGVVWGQGAHIYNVFHPVPPVEAVAKGNTITVFLRARNLWGFMHVDAYWDDVDLQGPSPLPVFVVQPAVTRYGGLKVRTMRNAEDVYIEAVPADARVTVVEGPVAEGGESWVLVRTAAGNQGWSRTGSRDQVFLAPQG